MGIVKRQSFKRSIVSYAGVLIGIVSMLFIYPLALERYGEAQFYISLAGLLAPVVGLGVQTLSVRFYPRFRSETQGDQGFLGVLLLIALLAMIIIGLLVWWGGDILLLALARLDFDVSLIKQSLGVVIALTICHVFLNLFSGYSSNAHRVVIPELLWNTGAKLGLPLLILLFHWGLIQVAGFQWGLVSLFSFIVLAMAWYLRKLGLWQLKINWSHLDRPLLRAMGTYALFGMLTVIGSNLAFRIDNLMVTSLINAESNGEYNIGLMMTNTILIPYNAILVIIGPIIADKWANNEQSAIADIYRRSALNLLLIGFFLMAALYLVLDDLLSLSDKLAALENVKAIVLCLGVAKVFDMTTGVNSQIIAFSKHYRFNLYVVLLLGVLTVLLNYWLIPIYGLVGAALATLLSLSLYNVLKFIFIWWKFGMQPFTSYTLLVLAIGAIAYLVTSLLPSSPWWWLNMIMLGGLFSLLYWTPVLYWRLSPDLNDWLETAWHQLLNTIRGTSEEPPLDQ